MAIHHYERDEQTARNRAANADTGEYIGPVTLRGDTQAYEWRTYAGRVLERHTRPSIMDAYYDEYFAVVLCTCDAMTGSDEDHTISVAYTSNRDESAYASWAEIDATPEVIARVKALETAQRARAARMAARIAEWTPTVGCRVEVIKGRKVPRGTVGDCFWIGHGTYGPRVGIKDASGNVHWTAITNVQVV